MFSFVGFEDLPDRVVLWVKEEQLEGSVLHISKVLDSEKSFILEAARKCILDLLKEPLLVFSNNGYSIHAGGESPFSVSVSGSLAKGPGRIVLTGSGNGDTFLEAWFIAALSVVNQADNLEGDHD